MKYLKEEEKRMKQALDTIIKDIQSIWDLGLLDDVRIPVQLEAVESIDSEYPDAEWYFIIDDVGIYMRNFVDDDYFFYAVRTKSGKFKRYIEPVDKLLHLFKNYDYIHATIMEKITELQEHRTSDMNLVDEIIRKYQPEHEVKLTLPATNNQHELKITKENGRTIGVLDFGIGIVKLVTDGSIRLVDESKIEQKKSKTK